MNGRSEHDNKIKNRTLDRLKKAPDIIESYYYFMSDKTALTKDNYIRQVMSFLEKIKFSGDINELKEIKPSDISQYLSEIGTNESTGNAKSERYIATIYFSISNFFDYLVNDGYLKENVCKKVSPPKIKIETTPTYLTIEEIKQIEDNIVQNGKPRWKTRDLLVFILGCTTGLRISSISEINIEDINIDEQIITVTEKGNKTRECMIGEKTTSLLKDWLINREHIIKEWGDGEKDALFITKYRKRMTVSAMEGMIKKYTTFLDKHITPHKLRHTCGTNLYAQTKDIYLVKEVLGHKNIANTMIYTHISDESKRQAANVLDNIM